MGHERLGLLPKSSNWRQIVDRIAQFDGSPDQTADLACATLQNVQSRFMGLPQDLGFCGSLKFLVTLAHSFGSEDPAAFCRSHNINLPDKITPLALAIELRRWLPSSTE
jgi:hypothetical protein